MMKRLTCVACCIVAITGITSFRPTIVAHGSYYIVVDKSDYELYIYDDAQWVATYPVVFGNNDLGDKLMEGDRRTPEGTFRIVSKRVHEKWHRFLLIDYPTRESYEKFSYRKEHGLIPSSARIGGSIGIHGVWPHEDYAVDNYDNWTQGCISMKNAHVEELYNMIRVGTKIMIRK